LFASQFGCESLEQAAVAFKLGNFVSVVKTDDFKALDFQKVKQLISHDEIIVSREEEVYEAVVSWVKHNILSRKSLFPELLKCLKLFSMSKHSLYGIQMEDLVTKNTTCSRIIHEGWAFVRGTQREKFGKILEISFSTFIHCFRAFKGIFV